MVTNVGDINRSLLSEESRASFTENEKTVIAAFEEGFIGGSEAFFEQKVSESYIQHAVGVGQGRQGIREMAKKKYWSRKNKVEFVPIHVISEGDLVVIHRLMRIYGDNGEISEVGAGVDIFRCDDQHRLAEHWHVLEPQTPDYDPNALTVSG